MKVIYTENPGRDRGVCYRLPNPFFGAISAATEVVIEGDYPNIVDAYKQIGVEVSQPKAAPKSAPKAAPKKEPETPKE